MSEELKPCPFCGGEPEFENTDERARLRCTHCGAEGGLFFFSPEECESGICDATEAEAITAWNRRTPGTEQKAQEAVGIVDDDGRAWGYGGDEGRFRLPSGTLLYAALKGQP